MEKIDKDMVETKKQLADIEVAKKKFEADQAELSKEQNNK